MICIFLYSIFSFFLEKKQIKMTRCNRFFRGLVTNTRVYNLISGPHITHFLAVVARDGNVWSKSLFWIEYPSKHSVQAADNNNKIVSQGF